ASILGVRAIFWAGGGLVGGGTIPVFGIGREAPPGQSQAGRRPALAVLREAAPGAVAIVAALLVCQALLQISNNGFQPMVVLRLLEHLSSGVEAVTGIAFAAAGLSSALASVMSARVARHFGFRAVGALAALLLAGSQLISGYGPNVPTIVFGAALAGAFFGMVGPIISPMIRPPSPSEVPAPVFRLRPS